MLRTEVAPSWRKDLHGSKKAECYISMATACAQREEKRTRAAGAQPIRAQARARTGRSGSTSRLLTAWALLAPAAALAASAGTCPDRPRNYTLTAEPPAWACARRKTLLLIRHAQGTHNLAELEEAANPTHHLREEHARLHAEHGVAWVLLHEARGNLYRDPLLTPEGERQAAELRALLAKLEARVDAVVLSPMRRTLQTAHLGIPQLHGSAAPATRPRVVATELLRERIGPYQCDLRLRASELRAEYAHVDFSEVAEEDELFLRGKEHGPDERAKLATRAAAAAQWLLERPEAQRTIAVVSHQHFLEALTRSFLVPARAEGGAADAREAGAAGVVFRNAELQTVHLCERA